MIPLIQLPQRTFKGSTLQIQVAPLAAAFILALIIVFQIGLLVMAFLKH